MKTIINITLEFEHSADVAPLDVVNHVLDVGGLQTSLCEYVEDVYEPDSFEITFSRAVFIKRED